jgi:hypothetical protein
LTGIDSVRSYYFIDRVPERHGAVSRLQLRKHHAHSSPEADGKAGCRNRVWNSLGRFVKRGEKGILILAPMVGRRAQRKEEIATEIESDNRTLVARILSPTICRFRHRIEPQLIRSLSSLFSALIAVLWKRGFWYSCNIQQTGSNPHSRSEGLCRPTPLRPDIHIIAYSPTLSPMISFTTHLRRV